MLKKKKKSGDRALNPGTKKMYALFKFGESGDAREKCRRGKKYKKQRSNNACEKTEAVQKPSGDTPPRDEKNQKIAL